MTEGQFDPRQWAGPDGDVGSKVEDQTQRCLRAYAENPLLIEEHANIERSTAQGGYGRRQIYELIQNGADELIAEPGGRIHVLLTEEALYCANEGNPISARGVEAILSAALSVKRGDEIGRFGMGFKSVLGVTDLPDFFSRTGSFRFDAEWAEKQIREVKPDVERTPTLRVAYPLDPDRASRSDDDLRILMGWASTVVRLPIDRKRSDWLATEIQNFPREFLLFSPHVGELILEDRVVQIRRNITLTRQNQHLLVTEGGESTAWRVVRKVHKPSEEARREAGELADRREIPIMWAVPTEGQRRMTRGKFWAFFPTHYETTLRGILNAPWKTNEDRQNLLEGPFNEELLVEASGLIVNNLADLSKPDDPAAHLDLMPARGRESPNWADGLITETVYELASGVPSLPDQSGTLRKPDELDCHPPGLAEDALKEWAEYPGRPIYWCHPSIDGRERRPRAERLLDQVHARVSTLDAWLEALADDGTPAGSIAALRTARRVLSADANARDRILASEIVLTNRETLSRPAADLISLPGEYVSAERELLTVHPEVMEDPVAKTVLLELGLREGDPIQEVRGIVAAQNDDLQPEEWESFWRLVRQAGHAAAAAVLVDSARFIVHAKAMDGTFRPVLELLMPGPIVSPDRGEDAEACLDATFHSEDIELLQNLGLLSAPRLGGGDEREGWFREYVNDRRSEFLESIDRDPHWNMLIFDDRPFTGPLSPLLHLSPESRARFTEAALAADPRAEDWVMYHRTRSHEYPQIEMINPLVWLLIEEGRLNTSLGVRMPHETVAAELKQWSEFFPVAENISSEQGMLLGLPVELEELDGNHWQAAMSVARGVIDDKHRGRFYGMACRHRRRPANILARVGKAHQLEKPSAVTAVSDEREMLALASHGTPVVLCDKQDLPLLVQKWGLIAGDSQVKTSIEHIPTSSPTPLADRWPLLAFALPAQARGYELVPCETLRLVTVTSASRNVEEIEFEIAESSILHQASMSEYDLLRRVVDELGLDIDDEDLVQIIEQRVQDERREELEKIAKIKDPAERLIAAVGVEPLRRLAGANLIEGAKRVRGKLGDHALAELVLAAHGVNTLKVLRDHLEPWSPPTNWAGSRRAREFVTSLGFDLAYAGFESAEREALLAVDGPLKLPDLHNFQRSISNDLRELLISKNGNRGLVSLPTGAGKTRVAVQTLVEAFKDGDIEGPILWVAQSDELCEQAVQSWREVWRSEGPEARMHVNRLWGSNEVSAVGSGLQVVVATIQKLRERRERSDYKWLWQADCLVIDEAHRAITPEYTALLETFGMGRGKRGIPLIGLTATPFRGENERETQQLAARYGRRLLDVAALGDNPYATLQEMGVLAEVEHEILKGSEVNLTPSERDYLKRFERMPSSVEGRLGVDADRNEILLESIGNLADDWTVLLFAASVEHAQNMAALLSLEGVPARAISAETESGARRHYVEEFRHGRIRVLTNYNVLTQGFDAPAVRAVYVARPTFSTNLYQQMVGRGLRGPLNGGGDTCRIVNVADNFIKFGEQLAFYRFDYLWNRST